MQVCMYIIEWMYTSLYMYTLYKLQNVLAQSRAFISGGLMTEWSSTTDEGSPFLASMLPLGVTTTRWRCGTWGSASACTPSQHTPISSHIWSSKLKVSRPHVCVCVCVCVCARVIISSLTAIPLPLLYPLAPPPGLVSSRLDPPQDTSWTCWEGDGSGCVQGWVGKPLHTHTSTS